MLPTSPQYYFFLAIVFLAFWALRRQPVALALILLANLFSYAKWSLLYLGIIPVAATCDFFIGRAMRGAPQTRRRWLLFATLTLNIGLIVACRYLPSQGIALPLTLSFYAFQALTYTIDIFRDEEKPIDNFLTYLSSVTFFPAIVAGPITPVASLAKQWKWKGVVLTGEEGSRALFLIALGAAKKFLLADYLAVNLVNRVFDLPSLYSGGDTLIAAYGYAFQLYYDFSGYSDIAIGSALLLGIRLPSNFNLPYRASNIADFWRRWHITFSNWLQNYLYFSLPGPRTRVMPYLNLLITMTLGGLWHGTSWNFLIWGILHGVGLMAHRLWRATRGKRTDQKTSIPGALATFHFVLLTWIFFRTASLDAAWSFLSQLGTLSHSRWTFDNVTPAFLAVLLIAAAGHFVPRKWHDSAIVLFAKTPAPLQAAALAGLVAAIQLVSASGAAPFIYSKF